MAAVVGYLYLSSLTAFAMDCYIAFQNMHSYFMLSTVPLADRSAIADTMYNKFIGPGELLFVANAIAADSVIIWRTWARSSSRSSTSSFLYTSRYGFMLPIHDADRIYTTSQILVWAFSLSTNILCTVLIGLRACAFRRETADLQFGERKGRGMSTGNVLSLLVESGFIYSFLWATQIVGYLPFKTNAGVVVADTTVRIGRQISGMYPTGDYRPR
ncbi:hypothetical protein FB45DRAFT_1065425 [Roridomyces roridus]|uniref:Uncharacterized protein n=1 Tax=Roridomyces roridus TaxID=1738132 RepID=A0AAD7B7B4_9AGAR|nr:hypothetical protein FB45DRAFT_1065425 [Roridomyces roridus]